MRGSGNVGSQWPRSESQEGKTKFTGTCMYGVCKVKYGDEKYGDYWRCLMLGTDVLKELHQRQLAWHQCRAWRRHTLTKTEIFLVKYLRKGQQESQTKGVNQWKKVIWPRDVWRFFHTIYLSYQKILEIEQGTDKNQKGYDEITEACRIQFEVNKSRPEGHSKGNKE